MDVNLGLDQDLINAVSQIVEASCAAKKMEKEELHPNQVKLDKNKNGKLDAHDFKLLRKEEDQTDENYVSNAQRKAVWASKNEKGVKEEVEELDELSKKTLGSYVKKAGQQRVNMANKEKELDDTVNGLQRAKHNVDDDSYSALSAAQDRVSKQRNAVSDKSTSRAQGIHTAIKKLTKEEVEEYMQTEAYEQLDELSKATLGSYVKKAHWQGGMADYKQGTLANAPKSAKAKRDEYGATSEKRQKGINTAVNKLTKEQVEEIEALAAKHGLGE
jgi:hypothetical protein